MRQALLCTLGGLMLAGIAPAAAEDAAAGRQVAGMCQTCHGMDGYARMPNAPHIGGEPQPYIESQLMAYKTGAREHAIMSLIAGGLSAQQIADVAAFYASHTAVATLPDGVSPADAPQACVSCHGADGLSVALDAPNITGEANIYLDDQLRAFRDGKRQHDVMSEIAAGLTNAEIRELANWYANVDLQIEQAQ